MDETISRITFNKPHAGEALPIVHFQICILAAVMKVLHIPASRCPFWLALDHLRFTLFVGITAAKANKKASAMNAHQLP